MIARLLAERPNLLLLDEPTNHVSFSVMEEFERAVDEFPGPNIAVSHDRWFTRQFRGRSLDVAGWRSDAADDDGCDTGGRHAHARRDR